MGSGLKPHSSLIYMKFNAYVIHKLNMFKNEKNYSRISYVFIFKVTAKKKKPFLGIEAVLPKKFWYFCSS